MSQRRAVQPCGLAVAVGIILIGVVWRAGAQAPTPGSDYARLQQLTSQLQASPANVALRQQIIALALTLPAPPAETGDALKAEGAGEYAFKHAQTPADFSSAAEAFEQAALIEPWVAANYYNAGQAYAKAGRFNRAIAALNWYLTAAPNANDRDAVLKRVGALEYVRSHPPHPQSASNVPPPAPPVRSRVGLKGYWHFISGKWVDGPFVGQRFTAFGTGSATFKGLSITGTRDGWRVCLDLTGGCIPTITDESDVSHVKFHMIDSSWTCSRTEANGMECLHGPPPGVYGAMMRLQYAR